MKVKIWPYRSIWGPPQFVNLLKYVGVHEETRYNIGDKTPKWLFSMSRWVESKVQRKAKIKIEPADVYSMDDTLAQIIVPMLQELRKDIIGSPYLHLEDIPHVYKFEDEWGDDLDLNGGYNDAAWIWLLEEMIWAFTQIRDDDYTSQFCAYSTPKDDSFAARLQSMSIDSEGLQRYEDRINNGVRLMGKYFRNLWT